MYVCVRVHVRYIYIIYYYNKNIIKNKKRGDKGGKGK